MDVIDYGIPTRSRPSKMKVIYAMFKSGHLEVNGEEIRTSSLSSVRRARQSRPTEGMDRIREDECLPAHEAD